MKYGIALITRLGLLAAKSEEHDKFDQRLTRTRSREYRRETAPVLFRTPRRPLEA